jgi:hypothetical protein
MPDQFTLTVCDCRTLLFGTFWRQSGFGLELWKNAQLDNDFNSVARLEALDNHRVDNATSGVFTSIAAFDRRLLGVGVLSSQIRQDNHGHGDLQCRDAGTETQAADQPRVSPRF